jgi:hypothetical protein
MVQRVGRAAQVEREQGERESGREPPRIVDADPTVEALDELSRALAEIAEAQTVLAQKVRTLRESRRSGTSWHDILTEEDGTPAMQLVSQLLARISGASGGLRKLLVEALRAEGVSIPAIAKLFGVSHQRVSNLLRRG